VIFVGQLYDIKDPMTLVKALEIAKRQLPNLSATLVGDGVLRQELQTYIESHQLNSFIRLAGHIPTEQIPYEKSDLFVNCSISELSSGAIAEALCSGVPVIGSAIGGNPEILSGHKFSELFPARDINRLAELIVSFGKKDVAERMFLSRQAIQYGEKNFSISRYVAQYRELGEKMIQIQERLK